MPLKLPRHYARPTPSRFVTRLAFLLIGLVLIPCIRSETTLQSVHEMNATGYWEALRAHPLDLRGVITLVDPARNQIVLQDDTGAVALTGENIGNGLVPGQRVHFTADDAKPYLALLPDFPYRPTQKRTLDSFETPQNTGNLFIDRIAAILYPPRSGYYHFWLAADDSAELWLSDGEHFDTAKRIATCYMWTKPHDWTFSPGQASDAVYLEAGKKYFIEAVHEQDRDNSHLSVAWEGPDLPQQIIAGKYLAPWDDTMTQTAPAGLPAMPTGFAGWYTWNHAALDGVWKVTIGRWYNGTVTAYNPTVTVEGTAPLPSPRVLDLEQNITPDRAHEWAQVEGVANFMSKDGDTLNVEISDGGRRGLLKIPNWHGDLPLRWRHRRVQAQGVGEPGVSSSNDTTLMYVWVSNPNRIRILDTESTGRPSRSLSLSALSQHGKELNPSEPVRVTGEIVARSSAETLILRDTGAFSGYFSSDNKTWWRIGEPVDIPMPLKVYGGLAVNSDSGDEKASATFVLDQNSPDFQQGKDIGFTTNTSKVSRDGQQITIEAAGRQIWNTPDQFHFHYAPIEGESELVVAMHDFKISNYDGKAGIMIRDSLDGDAQFVDVVINKERRPSIQWRLKAEGRSPKASYGSPIPDTCWLKLRRAYTYVTVTHRPGVDLAVGQRIEVEGFPSVENDNVTLVDASCRNAPIETASKPPESYARKAVAIADLVNANNEVATLDMFSVRGCVTFSGKVLGHHFLAVQDATGAIFSVPVDENVGRQTKAGEYIEVHSNPGWRQPPTTDFVADRILTLGTGNEPAPIRHPLEYLLPKRGEASWVEVEGIVRSVSPEGFLEVKDKGELFSVYLDKMSRDSLSPLVDSSIRIRGVITYPNERERLLLVPFARNMEVLETGYANPFTAPLQDLSGLTPSRFINQSVHRLRVAGTITLVDGNSCVLQNGATAARIDLPDTSALHPGESVEVVGFPDLSNEGYLTITHAQTRAARDIPGPIALPVSPGDVVSGKYTLRLVTLRGEVDEDTSGGRVLRISAPSHPILVTLPNDAGFESLPPSGSLVEVTGVVASGNARTELSLATRPSSSSNQARLVLRVPADLVILEKPRWWVVQRTLLATALVGAAGIIAMFWIQVLRRRVAQRTRELNATMEKLKRETQVAATLSERNRLAGEIHDSLEQGFSGLLLQLDTTAKMHSCPPDVRASLSLAQSMVSFSRAEVQHAVWDLQSPLLEDSDLPAAIEKIFHQVAPEQLKTTIDVTGAPRRLPPSTEHHLLRVAQEAITNAVKHAEATEIQVHVTYTQDQVLLTVRDNGKGFVPSQVLTGGLGHFGLRSLRGRAKKVSGQLRIDSEPGTGTTVSLTVPTQVL